MIYYIIFIHTIGLINAVPGAILSSLYLLYIKSSQELYHYCLHYIYIVSIVSKETDLSKDPDLNVV